MTLTTATSAFESRFNPFLFATIREDVDDVPLTVLSVIARRNVDPWEEAEKLAQLPGDVARGTLAAWLADIPAGSHIPWDSGAIAARLITLLPPGRGTRKARPGRAHGTEHESYGRVGVVTLALLYLTFIAIMFVAQAALKSHQATLRTHESAAASDPQPFTGRSSPGASLKRTQPR